MSAQPQTDKVAAAATDVQSSSVTVGQDQPPKEHANGGLAATQPDSAAATAKDSQPSEGPAANHPQDKGDQSSAPSGGSKEKSDAGSPGKGGGGGGHGSHSNETEEIMRRRVFVGNLPRECDPNALQSELEQKFGPVDSVNIIRDKVNNTSKGYGFVTFVSEETAQSCLSTSNLTLDGRQLNFGPARRRDKSRSHSHHGGHHHNHHNRRYHNRGRSASYGNFPYGDGAVQPMMPLFMAGPQGPPYYYIPQGMPPGAGYFDPQANMGYGPPSPQYGFEGNFGGDEGGMNGFFQSSQMSMAHMGMPGQVPYSNVPSTPQQHMMVSHQQSPMQQPYAYASPQVGTITATPPQAYVAQSPVQQAMVTHPALQQQRQPPQQQSRNLAQEGHSRKPEQSAAGEASQGGATKAKEGGTKNTDAGLAEGMANLDIEGGKK